MRLIDADALISEANSEGAYGYADAVQIAEAPTIEAKPIIHAHWIIDKGGQWAECSNPKCREASKISVMEHKDFCPACGAIMDEESVVVSDDDQGGETRSGETLTVCIVGGEEFQVFVADESERE